MDGGGDEPGTSETYACGNGDASVALRTVRTRNGVRLEIRNEASGSRIRLDPLGLESLSWQDAAEVTLDFTGTQGAGPATALERPTDGPAVTTFEFDLLNEFAEVLVRGLRVDGEDLLEIVAPRVGHQVRLSPPVLAAMAEHDTSFLSAFLETPYGPED